jgi:hypothetical protein
MIFIVVMIAVAVVTMVTVVAVLCDGWKGENQSAESEGSGADGEQAPEGCGEGRAGVHGSSS